MNIILLIVVGDAKYWCGLIFQPDETVWYWDFTSLREMIVEGEGVVTCVSMRRPKWSI